MENKKTVAVCVPTYNQAKYLTQSVESIIKQTLQPDEIWISDDASIDNTKDVAESFARMHLNIKYVKHEKNLGMGGNPNWIMRQPKTDYIAKLDSDDYYEPTYLEELVRLLNQYPEAGYAHANVNEVNDNSEINRVRLLNRNVNFVSGDDSLRSLVQGYKVAANIILFRRAALESVDFWTAHLAFADDWDLAVRLADKGWGNCHFPKILANYRVWSDSGGYRKSRKLSEITGVSFVFNERLLNAFAKRGWNQLVIDKSRFKTLKRHSLVLSDKQVTDQDRHALIEALKTLDNSKKSQRYLKLLGIPIVKDSIFFINRTNHRLKMAMKNLYLRFR